MGDFDLHNRKTSPYIPQNELNSTYNRKVSAYFTSVGYLILIKDKTSYLNGIFRNAREPHLDTFTLHRTLPQINAAYE